MLLEEGVKLIEESGVNSMTLREIGKRLKVSRTAAYRHFPDKAALLHAIGERGFTEFGLALEHARDGVDGSFAAKLDAMAVAYVEFAERRRAYYEVMFGVGREAANEGGEAGKRAFWVLVGTVAAGQAAGEFRLGDPVFLAKVLWSMVHGIALLRLAGEMDAAGREFVLAAAQVPRTGVAEIGGSRRLI